jgi:gluconolactonase
MANAVFRFTPETHSLRAVISRADILVPNGVASDASGRYLYITDTAAPFTAAGPGVATFGAGAKGSGSSAVYRYELDADCNPGNKQMFAMIRSGIADGIHVDDFGRVWTGESAGIVVRNSRGKVLGVFNSQFLLDEDEAPVANFALAGDKLVVLAFNRVLIVQLGQNVTTPARYHT